MLVKPHAYPTVPLVTILALCATARLSVLMESAKSVLRAASTAQVLVLTAIRALMGMSILIRPAKKSVGLIANRVMILAHSANLGIC